MSRRNLMFLLISLFLLPSALLAKPKVKTYKNTPDEVYLAALRTARSQHVVTFTDDKNRMFTFETGISALSSGFVANASVEPSADNTTQLTINVQHKNNGEGTGFSFNAGDRMADKFFEQVQADLANTSAQKVADKPDAAPVEPPTGTPAAPAVAACDDQGTINLTSNPDGADISVDGAFVGSAPAVLKLAPGKHTISIVQAGYSAWSKDLSVMAGSSVGLKATLTRQ